MLINHIKHSSMSSIQRLLFRSIQSSCIGNAASQSPLFKLRQKTGLAYSLCREALNKHDNQLDEAEDWLKAQAMIHGSIKATKVRGRSTREGLIGLAIDQTNTFATVLELNCETDFVARNQIFTDLVINLTERVASQIDESLAGAAINEHLVREVKLSQEQLNELDVEIVPIITKLSENIKVQRAINFKATDIGTKLFGQVHAQTGNKSGDTLNILTGRFGALVALTSKPQSKPLENLTVIGSRLCQHVIGYSPSYIELPENIRRHLEEAEEEARKRLQKDESTAEHEEGDQSDSDETNVSIHNNRDDWPSIMDQTLIMSEDTSVRDFCTNNEISITYFNRFECCGHE